MLRGDHPSRKEAASQVGVLLISQQVQQQSPLLVKVALTCIMAVFVSSPQSYRVPEGWNEAYET